MTPTSADPSLQKPLVAPRERPSAALFGRASSLNAAGAPEFRSRVGELTHLRERPITREDFEEEFARFVADGDAARTAVIFATWGMPLLTDAHLERMPALRAVFYAAGSVQAFARPLLERGILVFSAWQANAVPVAEFTLAQILLATKGYWANRAAYREHRAYLSGLPRAAGVYGKPWRFWGRGLSGGE